MMKVLVYSLCCCCLLSLFVTSCESGEQARGKVYTIARDSTWYPLDLKGKEDNVFAFSDEMLTVISMDQHVALETKHANWNNLFHMLQRGECDAVLCSKELSAPNEAVYDFSEPYLLVGEVLVVSANSNIKSLADLKGKILAVTRESFAALGFENHPEILLRPYYSPSMALQELEQGKYDGVVMGVLPAYTYCENLYPGVLKVATAPLTDKGLRLMTLRGKHPALMKHFDEGLKDLKKSGTYRLLLKKWSINQ
jgi:polar amino acid transport system substrate-binding protein